MSEPKLHERVARWIQDLELVAQDMGQVVFETDNKALAYELSMLDGILDRLEDAVA